MLFATKGLNPNKNYYFSRLSDAQKEIYNSILSGLMTFATKIKVSPKPINEITMIYEFVLLDNPLIFFTKIFKISTDLSSKKRLLCPVYTMDKKKAKEYLLQVNRYFSIFDSAKNKSSIEKVYFVHDFCLGNFSYDNSFHDYSFSVLGPVLHKTAVCEGIARFVKLSFDYLGVKSLVVTGTAASPEANSKYEPHAWNIIKIGKDTFHLDVTFDMTISQNRYRYDYLNLCDEDIKKDHCITGNVPLCAVTGKDYFTSNSLIAGSYKKLADIVAAKVKKGEKNIFVKLTNVEDPDTVIDKVMDIAKANICKGVSYATVNYNLCQCVFEIEFKG